MKQKVAIVSSSVLLGLTAFAAPAAAAPPGWDSTRSRQRVTVSPSR